MKRSMLAVAFLAAAVAACGLQVDRAELNKAQGADIRFINYVGPHTKIDTLAEIIGIGRYLGANVNAQKPGRFSYYGRYEVIHAVGNLEPGKLNADIFIIDKSAEVDDVVNVMRMVSGYLEAAYSYSPSDASILARFIVYYNAVYRGNLRYIDATYKSVVTQNVTAANVGIARVYSEWPGNTRMLIPLTSEAGKGNLSSVGSDQLTSQKVIQNLQREPGKGIPDRKSITELKQRQILQGEKKLGTEQAQIAREQQKLDRQKKALAAQQAKIAGQRASAATTEQKAQAAAAEAALKEKKAAVAKQQQKLDQKEANAAQTGRELAARQQNLQKERQSIASDQRGLLAKKQPPAPQTSTPPPAAALSRAGGKVVFVYDQEGTGEHLGRLVIIDSVSGKLLAESALNTIRGRRYERLAREYVVVAGRSGRGGAVRLVGLDASSLTQVAQSALSVAPSTALAVSGNDLYAVVDDRGTAHLARFDGALEKLAESAAVVDPYSYIAISGNEVYVQDAQGNILILDRTDLKEKKRPGG